MIRIAFAGIFCLWGADALVSRAARGRTFGDVASVPECAAALIPGCSERLNDGRSNLYFLHRIRTAAELYRSGKVRYLIVSGDNHIEGYDEPSGMKRALVARGVPADAIYCDYAGFRTLDSVVRAKAIFGQDRIVVVSQKFHNERAIFLARSNGIDAFGLNAPDVGGAAGLRSWLRERLARLKSVLDIYVFHTEPKFYGPPVPLGPPQSA